MFTARHLPAALFRRALMSARVTRHLSIAWAEELPQHKSTTLDPRMNVDFLKEVVRAHSSAGVQLILPIADSEAMEKILMPLSNLISQGKPVGFHTLKWRFGFLKNHIRLVHYLTSFSIQTHKI